MQKELLCTIGPMSRRPGVLERLEELGVSLFRINLSHTKVEDLPELIREQTALAALAGGGFEEVEPAALEGRLASGERAVAALHLAAHGSFQPSNPVFSGLSLGERVLTAHDVRLLNLDLELVTLSGCETGRVGQVGGEELVGIDQAFLAAGARAVVSSGWVVEDRAAAETMVELYRELVAGCDVASALARVQRARLDAGTHPFDWAAFAVRGDGAARPVLAHPAGM